jgi:hypothetical protein
MRNVEPWLGAAIILVAALDLLLTILYAKIGNRGLSRFGAGVGSILVARATWWLLRTVARPFGRRGRGVLSLSGPLSLLLVLLLWVLSLVVGAALVIHPSLGDSVRSAQGQTPTDFGAALYAAASSLSLASVSDLAPHSSATRLLYLADALIGTLMVALVISYVMPVYNALRDRNALTLTLELLSGETGEAAEIVAGLGPRGDFGAGQAVLADLAAKMTAVKEAHHFYPLLFFFHASSSSHSVVRCMRLALDTVSHLGACLDDERHAVVKESGSLRHLQRSTMMLVETLSATFLPSRVERDLPDDAPRAQWREQYGRACRRLAAAGITTRADAEAGARAYEAARAEWDARVRRIAVYLAHDEDDPDRRAAAASPAGTGPRVARGR